MLPESVCSIYSKRIFRYFIAVIVFLSACKPELDGPKYTSGTADFSRYVAIGADYTAGYLDHALTLEGQRRSYPALLSSCFSVAGGGTFRQPLVSPGNGYGFDFVKEKSRGRVQLVSYVNCLLQSDLGLEQLSVNAADIGWIGDQGPYNNLGIPGAKTFNLNSQIFGKGTIGNPFFYRIASDTGGVGGLSSTTLGDASLVNPSFFTLWIGLNDVLLNALAGGEANGSPTVQITSNAVFDASVDTIVTSLTSNGALGVIANIPDLTEFPFFKAIPYNGLLLDSLQADSLNATSPPGISFTAGANPFVISNPGGGSIRQIKEGELILLSITMDSLRCYGKGTPQKPISSKYVLDTAEINAIRQATQAYNAKLKNAATLKNLAFVDMNAIFKQFSAGYVFNGVSFSNQYLRNSVFSLDGIHPCSRGYAIIANEFVKVINAKYNSNLPLVDVNASPGNLFP
jgi:hypothetical protein